jgi:hypothetical protein
LAGLARSVGERNPESIVISASLFFAPPEDVQFSAVSHPRPSKTPAAGAADPWRLNELVRRRRLREQGRRSPAANLAEGLALSEFLSRFRGAARR